MKKFEEMSNSEILSHIKDLQAEHESLKIKLLKDFDKLEMIEKEFKKANDIIAKRIRGSSI